MRFSALLPLLLLLSSLLLSSALASREQRYASPSNSDPQLRSLFERYNSYQSRKSSSAKRVDPDQFRNVTELITSKGLIFIP